MPRTGMEPIRRKALVDAAIVEVGAHGAHAVTVGAIARRAGVSSALAHHYFGGKSDLLTAAMRQILSDLGQAVRAELAGANTPDDRVRAVIRASFAAPNFRTDVVSAWLNFYVSAQSDPQSMPEGLLVTVPPPLPALLTVRSWVISKVAVQLLSAFMVTVVSPNQTPVASSDL